MTHDGYWPRNVAAHVHKEDEGDPRVVCGICSLTESACRARAATNEHDFISRLDVLRSVRPAKDMSA